MKLSVFEIIMLLSFGCAWPVSIYKSVKSGKTAGKSLFFLIIICMGYFSGVLHKLIFNFDAVIYLYALNGLMVATDIALYFRNRKLEKTAAV